MIAKRVLSTLALCLLAGCVIEPPESAPREIGVIYAELTPDERLARATIIRDAAAANGISNGVLLGGIADSETGMAHCWSEATWACEGPFSDDCDGPVIAGAGDGPCSLLQGGLGMFQFDAGTHDDTLAREGERVLSIAGNVAAAVDFVTAMVVRSTFITGVDSDAQAKTWMNEVRVDGTHWDEWITTVTAYYNGCWPGSCSVFDERYARYAGHTRDILYEMGEAFWYDDVVLPECEPLGAEGGIIDETDICFEPGGDSRWLRRVTDAGWDDSLIWTHATENETVDNYGLWHIELEEAGRYLVEAYTDAAYAQSTLCIYQIHHGGVTDELMIDQSAAHGWRSLGEHDFDAGEGQWLRLDDNTGEPVSTEMQIVLDAVRLTRTDSPPDGDADGDVDGDVDGDADGDVDADVDADADGDGDGDTHSSLGGGCRLTPRPGASSGKLSTLLRLL